MKLLFLADESVDFNMVKELREENYEVKAIMEIASGIPDEEVLSRANELSAVLITEDKDFGELTYRLKLPNHGIILLRMNGESIEDKMNQLSLLFENYTNQMHHSFSVITINKIRVVDQL